MASCSEVLVHKFASSLPSSSAKLRRKSACLGGEAAHWNWSAMVVGYAARLGGHCSALPHLSSPFPCMRILNCSKIMQNHGRLWVAWSPSMAMCRLVNCHVGSPYYEKDIWCHDVRCHVMSDIRASIDQKHTALKGQSPQTYGIFNVRGTKFVSLSLSVCVRVCLFICFVCVCACIIISPCSFLRLCWRPLVAWKEYHHSTVGAKRLL